MSLSSYTELAHCTTCQRDKTQEERRTSERNERPGPNQIEREREKRKEGLRSKAGFLIRPLRRRGRGGGRAGRGRRRPTARPSPSPIFARVHAFVRARAARVCVRERERARPPSPPPPVRVCDVRPGPGWPGLGGRQAGSYIEGAVTPPGRQFVLQVVGRVFAAS